MSGLGRSLLQAHLGYNGAICGSDGTAAQPYLGVGWFGKSRGGAADARGCGKGEQPEAGEQSDQGGRSRDSHPGEGGPGPALYPQATTGRRLEKVVRSVLAARWTNSIKFLKLKNMFITTDKKT